MRNTECTLSSDFNTQARRAPSRSPTAPAPGATRSGSSSAAKTSSASSGAPPRTRPSPTDPWPLQSRSTSTVSNVPYSAMLQLKFTAQSYVKPKKFSRLKRPSLGISVKLFTNFGNSDARDSYAQSLDEVTNSCDVESEFRIRK